MRLKDFMSKNVETISPNESVERAAQKMRQAAIHHLVVLEGRDIVGIVAERDLGGDTLRPYANTDGLLVRDIMEKVSVTAHPDTSIREAANLMRGNTISCLPVLEDGKLAGIITTTDLLELLGQGAERIAVYSARRPITRENPGKKQASFNPKLGKT